MREVTVTVSQVQPGGPEFLEAKRALMEQAVTLRKIRRTSLKLGYLYLGIALGSIAANLAFHGVRALLDIWGGWCLAIGFKEIMAHAKASDAERFGIHIGECDRCGAIGTDGADDTNGAHLH
jgi:hypothetical protein